MFAKELYPMKLKSYVNFDVYEENNDKSYKKSAKVAMNRLSLGYHKIIEEINNLLI